MKHRCLILVTVILFPYSIRAANGTKKSQICVSGFKKLPCGQAKEEPMPVLSLPEVPGGGDGQRRYTHRNSIPTVLSGQYPANIYEEFPVQQI